MCITVYNGRRAYLYLSEDDNQEGRILRIYYVGIERESM
jgi:hypothetical protein